MTIPAMTHPLSKYWDQPDDIGSAPMDETHVLLTPCQFALLSEYSASIPTGVYPGKCWKRIERRRDGSISRTLLAWYGAETTDGRCPILFRAIEVVS